MSEDINVKLERIENKLDLLLDKMGLDKIMEMITPFYIMPEHYRSSYGAMLTLEKADASLVAGVTGRSRAVESSHLNRLVDLGFLGKYKDGRVTMFEIRRYK